MSIIKTRKHCIMSARERQLNLNELAVNGGRPYIDARLWRAPNETDTSWNGDFGRGIVGRKERTSLTNDAGRIANKINQYIFKSEATRKGADDEFLRNCTGKGESVHDFMQRVCLSITYGRWCWIQVDRAPLAESETLADKPPVRWILWDAVDVPDWCMDEAGNLKWIITRSSVYLNDNPLSEAHNANVFTLYRLEDGHVYITEETDKVVDGLELRTDVELPGLDRIPFALIGTPSADAWWYDDVENIQAQILNLDSMHNETLTETVYPQLVAPASLANSLEVRLSEKEINGEKVCALIRELTLGRKIPILESAEDKGITRYIAPGGDLKMLTDEGTRKRALLFDMAGLALFNKETRQLQTAESKQFDQLDTNSTLGNRALILQGAEEKAIELSKVFDPGFREWEPTYSTDFDVVDVAALGQALTQAANMPNLTPKVKKITAKIGVRVLKELAAGIVPDDEFAEALEEIEETDFEKQNALPDPFADPFGRGSDDEEDEPEEASEDTEDDPEDDENRRKRINGFSRGETA